tara:strand:- start:59 stop:787 length:729 start_codon:yes stop_codon:yes gene_type:complete
MDILNQPPNDSFEVILRSHKPFGIGGRRLCFVDPRNDHRCIKVLRQDERRTVRSQTHWIPQRWRRVYDNNAHEQRELATVFKRIGPNASQCLPRCYGPIETDLGPGLVLDLIRDHDGKISRSLRELVSIGYAPTTFRAAFETFAEFMVENSILSRAILEHNLAAQHRQDGSWHLFLIDGLGDPAWLPFARFSRHLAQAKIKRKLEAFWPRLERLADEPVAPETVANSNWGQGFLDHRGDQAP